MIIRANKYDDPSPAIEQLLSDLTIMAQSQMTAQLRSKVDPGDIVQETMLEAFRDIEKFRGKSEAELRAWLRVILSNNVVSAVRHHSRHKRNGEREVSLTSNYARADLAYQSQFGADPSSPGLKLIQQEQTDEVTSALGKLRSDERAAVALKYLDNRSVAEIAQSLGRTQGAVAGLLRRGMKKLRAYVRE